MTLDDAPRICPPRWSEGKPAHVHKHPPQRRIQNHYKYTSDLEITIAKSHSKTDNRVLVAASQAHIEGATAQVKDEDILFADSCVLLVQAVRNGGCSWLVNDAKYFQPSNDAGIFGRLQVSGSITY